MESSYKSVVDRRTFVSQVTLATGYALAVSPVTALAISTPSADLHTETTLIPSGSEKIPAFVAWPQKKKGPLPAVIVIHEIFGIHEYIRDICRRLASEGYYAIAPYLYFRQGDATQIADIPTLRSKIVSKVEQKTVLADLDATVDWVKSQKNVQSKNLAMTGFCWGGNATWMYAAHNSLKRPSLSAAVAWYGRLVSDSPLDKTPFPVDVAAKLKTPVLGLYGGKDTGIPVTSVERMRQELGKGTSGSKIIIYPEAEHGFHADYRPSYNEKAAAEAWNEMLAWFKRHGV